MPGKDRRRGTTRKSPTPKSIWNPVVSSKTPAKHDMSTARNPYKYERFMGGRTGGAGEAIERAYQSWERYKRSKRGK